MGDNAENATPASGKAVGYALTLLQAAFYSTMGVLSRILYQTGLTPAHAMLLRFLATVVFLGAFMVVWRKQRLFSRKRIVYVQALFFFLCAWLFFLGIERLGAGLGTMLFLLYPLAVALINGFVFGEKMTAYTALALALALAGMVLVSGALAPGGLVLDPLGIVFSVSGGVAFAVYTVLIQRVGNSEGSFTTTFTVAAVSLAGSLIVFAPHVGDLLELSAFQWAIGAAIALMNTIIPIILFIFAVRRIGATEASLVGLSECLFALLLSFLILGETVTPMQGAGIVLIVVGLVLVTAGPLLNARRSERKDGRP